MPKFFVKTNQINKNRITLYEDDVNHIANVLRKQIGEKINICNMDTSENFLCKIKEISKENIECEIIKTLKSETESSIDITIFQGLPKAEKMELIIQKCTELGVNTFVPVQMERCIVKLDTKSEIKKLDRWKKIAETAAKQSGRDIIPKVENIINLQKLLYSIQKYDIVLLAYENEKENTLKNALNTVKGKENLKIGVIIGPEGGIEEKEVEQLVKSGAQRITLGKRILRTETVGIVISSIITYELE